MKEQQRAVFAVIEEKIGKRHRPLVVGISGCYTAGKTTLTEALSSYLLSRNCKTQIVHYDDFHKPFSDIRWTDTIGSEVNAFYNEAFNPQKLIDEILHPLRENGELKQSLKCVDLGTSENSKIVDIDIDADTIVLLEGVLLLRPPLLDYLDFKVYLDISFDEMMNRGRDRDAPRFGDEILEKYITRYIPVQKKHFDNDNPREHADIIIDNNKPEMPFLLGPEFGDGPNLLPLDETVALDLPQKG